MSKEYEYSSIAFNYNLSDWPKYIDEAVKAGVGGILIPCNSAYAPGNIVGNARKGLPDKYKPIVDYARSKGLRVMPMLSVLIYGIGGHRWYTDISLENEIVADFTYLLDNYAIAGIELEEPFNTEALDNPSILNRLLGKLHDAIIIRQAQGKLPANFQLGASCGSLGPKTYVAVAPYWIENNIFQYLRPEINFDVKTITSMRGYIDAFTAYFPGVAIRPTLYALSGSSKAYCIKLGHSGFDHWTCYYQTWFDFIEDCHKRDIGFYIYYLVPGGRVASRFWPNDIHAGYKDTDRIAGILGGATGNSPPVCSYTISEV